MKYFFLVFISVLITFSVVGQSTINLKGTIIDASTKEPLAFAYVMIKGAALGTVTNGDGDFSINIPEEHNTKKIVFSYLGYATQTLTITQLKDKLPTTIYLKVDATEIKEVVIKPRKKLSVKQVFNKVLKNIEVNYSQTPVILDGYYRETITENNAFISYADAAVKVHYTPYQEKNYKWADYKSPTNGAIYTLSTSNTYGGKTLHRWHFASNTIAKDQAKIIDVRSSKNLTQTDMFSYVEGGPLSLFGKDYLKYKELFFGDKKFKKFNFELGEVELESVGYVYVISFKTVLTKELMEKLDKKGKYKAHYKTNKYKALQGKIYIDRDDFAVLKFECSVPNEFKKYICSYEPMNYKHFDFKLRVDYKKIGNTYYLSYLKHEDEFILNDTIADKVTPYNAVSQFWVNNITTENVISFKPNEIFRNLSTNHLYDLPLEYNSDFWKNYTSTTPISTIPDSIRMDMEVTMSLEKQFEDKHKRNDSLQPPIAKVVPSKNTIHNTSLTDNYAWLKQPKNPLHNNDIKDYLVSENEYTNNYFIPLRKNQRELFTELISRVNKKEKTIPQKRNGYWYQTRWTEEDDYPIYLRKKEGAEIWDTLMNVNSLAKNHDYYTAGGINVKPDNNQFLYFENTTGSDKYIVKFKNIKSDNLINDSLVNVSSILWLNHNQLLYTVQEPKTNRSFQLKLHELNKPQSKDSLLFQENDSRFGLTIYKSKSKNFIYLSVSSSNTNEVYFLDLKAIDNGFQLITPREKTHKYSVTDYKEQFYIFSNKDNIESQIYRCNTRNYKKKNWEIFIKPKKGTRITDYEIFENFLVIEESENMTQRLKIIDKTTGKSHYIKIKEDLHLASIGVNPTYNSDTLQYSTSSMTSTPEVWNYNMKTHDKRLVKKIHVNNYRKSGWIKSKRVWTEAKDGTKIPITLLYNPFDISKHRPYKRMFMTSYGSYGSSSTPTFNRDILSLVNRGFVYAIAHVRGGGELGEAWHNDGKMMHKKNTFTDFIDCAEYLIAEGYAQKGNIVAEGGSAGGLLMGSIANMRPDLFKMIILDVPFVDVINTMFDDKLPLTTIEYEEWGNPNKKKEFEYMLSYSPYDNVKAQDYPHMLFTTGINDTRVGYWEPAKMVAKLRKLKTDDNLLFLKTDLFSGHGGGSGRFDYLKELSYKYALILDIFAKDIFKDTNDDNKTAND